MKKREKRDSANKKSFFFLYFSCVYISLWSSINLCFPFSCFLSLFFSLLFCSFSFCYLKWWSGNYSHANTESIVCCGNYYYYYFLIVRNCWVDRIMKNEDQTRSLFGISLSDRSKWQQFLICSSGFFFGYLVNGICEVINPFPFLCNLNFPRSVFPLFGFLKNSSENINGINSLLVDFKGQDHWCRKKLFIFLWFGIFLLTFCWKVEFFL